MDKIRALSMTGHGFFIDLADVPCAYSVTPNEGIVQISHKIHASIPGEKVKGFSLEEEGNDWNMVVHYESANGPAKLSIGIIFDEESARCWIERVNKLYHKR